MWVSVGRCGDKGTAGSDHIAFYGTMGEGLHIMSFFLDNG